jgi:hypothetical protein
LPISPPVSLRQIDPILDAISLKLHRNPRDKKIAAGQYINVPTMFCSRL